MFPKSLRLSKRVQIGQMSGAHLVLGKQWSPVGLWSPQ